MMADTPRLKTQQPQAESVCLLGMGFLFFNRSLTQRKVLGPDVSSPLFKDALGSSVCCLL